MIIKGIFYDDQLRNWRLRVALVEAVSEIITKLPKKTLTGRPDIGFTLKMPPKSGGGAIEYPKPPSRLPKSEAESPYWSQQIYSSAADDLNFEYMFRSRMPITSTATMGGAWSAAAAGWLFNKFLKTRIRETAINTSIRNPYAVAGLLYVVVAGVAVHDTAIVVTRTPAQRSFWLGGWKLDMGMSMGSAIT